MELPVGLQSRAEMDDRRARPADASHRSRDERSRRVRFLAVGVWNTVFAYSVWAILQVLLADRLHYLVILVMAWPIAVLNAYLFQRRLVFRSSGRIRSELPRFSAVYVLTLAASLVLLPILLEILPLNIYAIQAGFTAAVVVLSYVAHRSFSFRQPSGRSRSRFTGGTDER